MVAQLTPLALAAGCIAGPAQECAGGGGGGG